MINDFLGIAENAAEHGVVLDHMLEIVHWFMALLFIGWSCFFVFVLWRFRRRKSPAANYHGVQSHTSTHLEISVVIIEAILLLGFAFPLWAVRVNDFPDDEENPLKVRVIGEQFFWSIHYPGNDGEFGMLNIDLINASNPLGIDRSDPFAKDDVVMRNAINLPVDRPAIIEVGSKDVIHNFAMYSMRIAQDAIPGSSVPMWFTPTKTGEWEVICGQLCGSGHFSMKAIVNVQTEEDFNKWYEDASKSAAAAVAAPPTDPEVEALETDAARLPGTGEDAPEGEIRPGPGTEGTADQDLRGKGD